MRTLLLTLFSFALLACSDGPSERNIDYHKRLQSQLDLPELTPFSDASKLSATRVAANHSSTISLLQLAQIQHCELGQLIAEHNSQLGKVALPSRQFRYQLGFLQLAPKCLTTLNNAPLESELRAVINNKHAQLINAWHTMVLHDAQLKALYLASPFSLDIVNQEQKQASLQSLDYLYQTKQALIEKRYQDIDVALLEFYLSKLHKNLYIPSLLRAINEQIYLVEQQTALLNTVAINSLCKKGHNRHTATVLTNIFSKFYGQKIQPYHNHLLNEYRLLHPYLASLWTNINHAASIKAPLALEQKLKTASLNHVRWWQRLYKLCEINPGA